LAHLKSLLHGARTHQGFRRYFANTSWVMGEQLLRLLAELTVGIWVARYLGAEQFGLLSYALAFVAIFGVFARLGLDSITVRDLVNRPDQADRILATAFWLKLGGGVLAFMALVIALAAISVDAVTRLYVAIIAIGMIFQSMEVVVFYFQSRVLSKHVSVAKLIQLGLSSLMKIYLVAVEASLEWFVLVSLIDQVVLAGSYYVAFRLWMPKIDFRFFDRVVAKQLLGDSWPLIFSGLVVMIYMRIDQIMIKEMMGNRAVGIYSVAVRLSEVWYFVPMVITASVFPSIVNAKKKNEALYYARLQRLYSLMVAIAVAVAVPTTFIGDWLVVSLYGEEYRLAGDVLKINIWAGIFVFLGVASGSWLANENLQYLDFFRTFSGAVANVLLNLVLIPAHGLIGAAVATVISYMIAGFLFDVFNGRTRQLFLMKVAAFGMKGMRPTGTGR